MQNIIPILNITNYINEKKFYFYIQYIDINPFGRYVFATMELYKRFSADIFLVRTKCNDLFPREWLLVDEIFTYIPVPMKKCKRPFVD